MTTGACALGLGLDHSTYASHVFNSFGLLRSPTLPSAMAFAKNGDRADFGVVETGWGSGMKLSKPGRGLPLAGGDVSQDTVGASFVLIDTGIISAGSSTT